MSRLAMVTSSWPTFFFVGALSCLLACGKSHERPENRRGHARALYGYCVQCHGQNGEGDERYRAPAIAGLSAWYIAAQLNKFRIGARGDHPDDVEGLRMRPMSRTLGSWYEIGLVADYVASMPRTKLAPKLSGNAEHGAKLYAPCVQCHGENAEGKREMNAPPLTTTGDWYLLAQLQKFKQGIRGKDPLDPTGSQMRAMTQTLEGDEAMRDVVAYVSTLASPSR